ncbi:MAG: hypothetical protein ACOVNR_03230, partial [Chitinophagaceae bacterium]
MIINPSTDLPEPKVKLLPRGPEPPTVTIQRLSEEIEPVVSDSGPLISKFKPFNVSTLLPKVKVPLVVS